MRSLSNLATAVLFVGMALLPARADADTIVITSGSLVTNSETGRVQLAGSRGLQLDAVGTMTGGLHWPQAFCEGVPTDCVPGSQFPLTTRWSGSDFTGSAGIDGKSFLIGAQTDDKGGASVDFDGSFLVPLFTGAELASAVAPFTFTGFLSLPLSDPGAQVALVGQGTAQINLRWVTTAGGGWDFDSAVFQFEETAPVPEPATLALVGSGLACLIRRRVRRRAAD